MGAPRAVVVAGFKDAGKTRVVEALVAELTHRGHRVGTLKHTAEDQPLDKPGTDTWRHAEAGAVASAILSETRTAVFLKKAVNLQMAADALGDVDYIVLEGFKTIAVAPRIIVPRTKKEVGELSMGIEIAAVDVDGAMKKAGEIPVVSLGDVEKLTDLVEAHAYPLLAGLDCKACGYTSCLNMGKAILSGDTEAEKCVRYRGDIELRVNGSTVAMNPFVQSALRNVVLGFLKTLKGTEQPQRVELEFEVRGDG